MANVIEGEGLQADPVRDEKPNNLMGNYLHALRKEFSMSRRKFDFEFVVYEEWIDVMAPYFRFNNDMSLSLLPVPKEVYLGGLRMTSPRQYDILARTDLIKSIPEKVDVQAGFSGDSVDMVSEVLGLSQDIGPRSADSLQKASQNGFVIPNVEFLAQFFRDPWRFLEYVNATQTRRLQGHCYFSYTNQQGGFSNLPRLPRTGELFNVDCLEKAVEKGMTKILDVMEDYHRRLRPLIIQRTEPLTKQEREELFGYFADKHPELMSLG